MEIRNLISFIQVAELNSFTKAADKLGYSQSTISFQIKQLEVELGCLLFERINHTITLTEHGRALLEYAHSINRLTEEFSQAHKREEEIERYAYHRQQYTNELSAYRHSQCDVATMLSKNTDYKNATPYQLLRADIEKLLGTLMVQE